MTLFLFNNDFCSFSPLKLLTIIKKFPAGENEKEKMRTFKKQSFFYACNAAIIKVLQGGKKGWGLLLLRKSNNGAVRECSLLSLTPCHVTYCLIAVASHSF